jgi:hypothetical protein
MYEGFGEVKQVLPQDNRPAYDPQCHLGSVNIRADGSSNYFTLKFPLILNKSPMHVTLKTSNPRIFSGLRCIRAEEEGVILMH